MPPHDRTSKPTVAEGATSIEGYTNEVLHRVIEGHTCEVLEALDNEGFGIRAQMRADTAAITNADFEHWSLMLQIETELRDGLHQGFEAILAALNETRGPLDDLDRWCIRISSTPFTANLADHLRNAIGGLAWPIRNGHIRRDLVAARLADAAAVRGMERDEALAIVTDALKAVRPR